MPKPSHKELRRAVAEAVDYAYFGAAGAAGLALLVLVFLAPRRFPLIQEPVRDDEVAERM